MTPYQQGRAAYDQGITDKANPFPMKSGSGTQRTRWYDGWYDARIVDHIGPILTKLGSPWE